MGFGDIALEPEGRPCVSSALDISMCGACAPSRATADLRPTHSRQGFDDAALADRRFAAARQALQLRFEPLQIGDALAQTGTTLVVYMGVSSLQQGISSALHEVSYIFIYISTDLGLNAG